MLIFGLILMMSATSLVGLTYEKKHLGDRREAYQLAQNLMETLLALPLDEAKSLEIDGRWSSNGRYDVGIEWKDDAEYPGFEKVSLEYGQQEQKLIQLSSLHSIER